MYEEEENTLLMFTLFDLFGIITFCWTSIVRFEIKTYTHFQYEKFYELAKIGVTRKQLSESTVNGIIIIN